MRLDLGYKVDVAAIPIKILSKFPVSPLQNALEHCHDCLESVSIALMKQNMQQKYGLEIGLQNFSKMV